MRESFDLFLSSLKSWQIEFFQFMPKLLIGIVAIIIIALLTKSIKRWSLLFYQKTIKGNINMAPIFASTLAFVFLGFGVFMVLDFLGFEKIVTNVFASAGVLGIVAGFAFKDIASNLFAGILLRFRDPFHNGNWVEIDGTYGTVADIGIIMTQIDTVPGQRVYIPNQLIFSNSFKNFSFTGKRRVEFVTGVSYGDDLDLVRKVALEEAASVSTALKELPIDCYFTSIGGYSYNFVLRFWINFEKNDDYMMAMNEIIIKIKKRFEKENICIAYPVTTLDFGVKGGVNIYDNPLKIKQEN